MEKKRKSKSAISLFRAMGKTALHLLNLSLSLLNLLKIPDEPSSLNFVVQIFTLDKFIALLEDFFEGFIP